MFTPLAFNQESIVTRGLVLYLDAADRTSYLSGSGVWGDLSGNGNNGTLQNTPTYNTNNFGTLSFNGADEYINFLASNTTNIRSSITVGMFCKSNGASSTGWSMYWAGVSKYSQFILGPNNVNGKMAFLIYSNEWLPNGYSGDIWGQSNIDIRKWHYYTGVYNQSTGILYLYVDGVEQASFNIGIKTLSDDPNNFTIGKRDISDSYLNFTLSHVQIYNKALSQQEITQNYNALKGRFDL